MWIDKIESDIPSNDIAWKINVRLAESRFTACVQPFSRRVKITEVRLRTKKLYCGNHPKACERAFGGKHKRLDYLEGADWVEFNDMLNDILDQMGVVCRVHSTLCIVRKGRLRRTRYEANTQQLDGNWQWDKDGPDWHYVDNCGGRVLAGISQFPDGTPGIHEPDGYFCVGAHDHDH